MEGFGISHVEIVESPSFAQTKRSSDDLVAASSTASTPANMILRIEDSYGQNVTPAAKESPPLTPETPTPQQRRKDTLTETESTPTKTASDSVKPESKDVSTKAKREFETPAKDMPAKSTPAKDTPAKATPAKSTPSPSRIPKYRIALSSNMLSPARTPA
jgi:hypothetical protein